MAAIGVLATLGRRRPSAHPVFRDRPAQLIPLANRPLIGHVIDELREASVRALVLATSCDLAGELGAAMTALAGDLPTEVIVLEEGAGECAAAAAARPLAGPDHVILHRGTALLCGGTGEWPRLLDDPVADAAVINGPRDTGEDAPRSSSVGHGTASLGITVLSPAALDALADAPGGAAVEPQLGTAGVKTVQHLLGESWMLNSDPGSVLAGNRAALSQVRPCWEATSIRGSTIEGQVTVAPTALIEDSLVRGPAVIGADAVIRHAYVGPYTSIGAGSLIENAEIEHSIVLRDVRIRHVGWRLERSLIGDRAQVCRGFRLPQAVHLQVGEDARISVS